MKLLLAAAFAFTAYTQQLPNLSSNGQIAPPIVLIEEESTPVPAPAPVPEAKENNVIQIDQKQEIRVIQIPLVGKQQFNPTSFVPETNSVPVEQTEPQKKVEAQKQQKVIINGEDIAVDKHDHGPIMPGQHQFTPFVDPQPMPMPGQQEFNPTNFVPKHNQKHDKKKRDHEIQKHQNQRQKHEEKKRRHEKDMQRKLRNEDKISPQFEYNQDPASPQEWEKNAEQGHKKRKFHKKLWIPLTIVAVLFTLIGLLLGKCIRKIKKQKKCKRNAQQLTNMPIAELEEKIKSKEQNLNKLKEEYHNKKAMENSQAQMRAEQVYFNPHEMQMIQRIQPQQLRGYPQQQYPGYGQIPVGRPLQQM